MEVVKSFSDQQRAIIESPTKGLSAAIAYAGCGKSTTLVGYALARSSMKILYLCFNRSVSLEARKTFKSAGAGNVKPMTMHSLAYHEVGVHLADKLVNSIEPAAIEEYLMVAGIKPIQKKAVALFALKTVANYCNSVDEGITTDHLPLDRIWEARLPPEMVLTAARNLFKSMLNNPGCPASHDIYMKVFQLSKPDLSEFFDLVMVDEGQDLNPVVEDILLTQTIPMIIVGDPHQSIYGFRGSVNALEADYIDRRLWLNESYRFGKGHADLATKILSDFKGIDKPLIGLGKAKSIILLNTEVQTINQQGNGGLEIYRTNGALFQRAIDLVMGKKDKETGEDAPPKVKSVRYVGGLDSYNFTELVSAYKLYKDNKGYGAFERYNSWDDYSNLAEMTQDPEMKSIVSTVERFKGAIPVFVQNLKKTENTSSVAPVTLTNAHKSKGLEADVVRMGGDFPHLMELADTDDWDVEEVNLQYVATTRAKRKLGIPAEMAEALRMDVDKLRNPGQNPGV